VGLVHGRQSVGSLRGASGAEHSPFLALRRATTTEDAETRSARYVMHIFELGSGFRYMRRGGHMRHLGNGGYMAVKKYS